MFDCAGDDPGRCLNGNLYLFFPDVEVGAQTHEAWFAWGGEHAFAPQYVQELGRFVDRDEDEVGLRVLDVAAGFSQAGGELAGTFVVVGKSVYVVLESVEGGGGDHTRLSH